MEERAIRGRVLAVPQIQITHAVQVHIGLDSVAMDRVHMIVSHVWMHLATVVRVVNTAQVLALE